MQTLNPYTVLGLRLGFSYAYRGSKDPCFWWHPQEFRFFFRVPLCWGQPIYENCCIPFRCLFLHLQVMSEARHHPTYSACWVFPWLLNIARLLYQRVQYLRPINRWEPRWAPGIYNISMGRGTFHLPFVFFSL